MGFGTNIFRRKNSAELTRLLIKHFNKFKIVSYNLILQKENRGA
jgi:hypothetical protein